MFALRRTSVGVEAAIGKFQVPQVFFKLQALQADVARLRCACLTNPNYPKSSLLPAGGQTDNVSDRELLS